MTTLAPAALQLMTVVDYLALGQNNDGPRTELQEGNLVMVPSPAPRHNLAYLHLGARVEAQLPPNLRAIPDVDLDLQLVPTNEPGTVRQPDLVVVTEAEYQRVGREGGVLRASGCVLVVEIVSPGSRRTDRTIKRSEYADAGIGHYWIIDLDSPVSLVQCRLGPDGYVDSPAATGVFQTSDPFPATVDLDALG